MIAILLTKVNTNENSGYINIKDMSEGSELIIVNNKKDKISLSAQEIPELLKSINGMFPI